MTEEELLKEAREHARSFPGLLPPNNAVFIGMEKLENNTYFYYRDDEGRFYYDSVRARRFEKEMQERKKERDRKRWRNRSSGSLYG